jgi:hypothetical protein
MLAVTLTGAAAASLGLEPRFRTSSLKKRILSVFSLGTLVVRSAERTGIRWTSLMRQLKVLRERLGSIWPKLKPPRSQNRNVKLPLPHNLFCADCGWKGRSYGWPA